MTTPQGNVPQKYIWQFVGDPTNALVSQINPPKGALVINNLNGDVYRKTTEYGDNSGYLIIPYFQLPVWTFTSGNIGNGLFTTDTTLISSTEQITFSKSVIGAVSLTPSPFPSAPRIVMTDSVGRVTIFTADGIEDDGSGNARCAGVIIFTSGTSWAGKYSVTFWAGV